MFSLRCRHIVASVVWAEFTAAGVVDTGGKFTADVTAISANQGKDVATGVVGTSIVHLEYPFAKSRKQF
jgi:hypothetical protein